MILTDLLDPDATMTLGYHVFSASHSIFVLHVEPRLKVISSPEEECVYVTGATCYDQGPCPTNHEEVLAPPH